MMKESFVAVNGVDLFYVDAGIGTPIIFIHGSIGTHIVWQPYYTHLSKKFRTLAFDQRGHGKSVYTAPEISHQDLVADLIAFIEALELEDVILCGWSLGGDLAIKVAMEIPNKISKLVIGGLTLRQEYPESLGAIGLNRDGTVDRERIESSVPDLIANWKSVHTQSENHWYQLISQMGSNMVNPPIPTDDDIASVELDTLTLWGDRDQFIPLEDAVKLYNLLPNAQLAVIPNTDHFVTRTHIDYVLSLIDTFLEA